MPRYGHLTSYTTLAQTKKDIKETFRKWPEIEQYDIKMSLVEAEVIFWANGHPTSLKCDRFYDVETNLRAIYLVLEPTRLAAQRGILQELAAAAVALLPAGNPKRPPHEVLGIAENADIDIAEAVHRTLAKRHHPDVGGSNEKMQEINDALEEFKLARSTGKAT